MKVFVDTGAFIALADKSDKHYVQAIKVQEKLKKQKSKLIISDYIFDETLTWLRYKAGYEIAVNFGKSLLDSNIVDMVIIEQDIPISIDFDRSR